LSFRDIEDIEGLYAESHFSVAHVYSAELSWCFLWSRLMALVSGTATADQP